VKKIFLLILIVFFACPVQGDAFSIAKISEEAENNFKIFINDTTNLKFEISDKNNVLWRVYKKGKQVRIEGVRKKIVEFAKKEVIESVWFYDGETGNNFSSFGEAAAKGRDYYLVRTKNDVANPFYLVFRNWWEIDKENAQITGSELFLEKDCYVINYRKPEPRENYKIWVDKETLLLLKEEKTGSIEGAGQKDPAANKMSVQASVRQYKDFRKVAGGLAMPFITETVEKGKENTFKYLKALKLGENIPEDLFLSLPEKIKASNITSTSSSPKPEAKIIKKPVNAGESAVIDALFEDARNKFKNFLNDDKPIELVIDRFNGFNIFKIFKKGKKIRIESQYSRATEQLTNQMLIYDGAAGEILQRFQTAVRKSSFIPGKESVHSLFYQVFKDWWELDKKNVVISGSENVDGKDCYIIEFGEFLGYKIWVGKDTLSLLKDEQTFKLPQDRQQITVRKFTGYKEIEGKFEMPFVIESQQNGNMNIREELKMSYSEIIISFKTNADIPDDYFTEEVTKIVPPEWSPNRINTPEQETQHPLPVFEKEENIVLRFNLNVSPTSMNISNASTEIYKGFISGSPKIGPNDFIINLKVPVYISKIIFKAEGKPARVDLPVSVYYDLGAQVSYLNENGDYKSLKIFNPVGKNYYEIEIKDFVSQIKVKNTHPEYKMKDNLNLFSCIFLEITKLEFNCIAGRESVEKKAKAEKFASFEKKKEAEKALKIEPLDEKMTNEILPGLIEKAKTALINKDRKNSIEMIFTGSSTTQENKIITSNRLDGKIFKGSEKIRWEIFSTTADGNLTHDFRFIHDYTSGSTSSLGMRGGYFSDSDLSLNWWQNTLSGLEILRIEKSNERDCYLIRKNESDKRHTYFWVDRENNRLLRVKRESIYITGEVKIEEVNYSYKNTKQEGFEFPSFIKMTGEDNLRKTVSKILILSKKFSEPDNVIYDEKAALIENSIKTELKCKAINRRNKIEKARETEIEQFQEELKDFKSKKRYLGRSFSDAITGFSFVVPEDFSRSIYYYNVYKFNPVNKKKKAQAGDDIIEGDGKISIHKNYTSENLETITASYKERLAKKYPGAKIDDKTRVKIKATEVIVLKIEYENEDGETVKSREVFLKVKNTLVTIDFEYELLPEEEADKYQKNMLSTITAGEATRVAHSFFSPKLEEIYKLKEEKKYEETEKVIEVELVKFPEDAELLFLKAVMLAKKGKDEPAAAALKTAFESGYCDFASIFEEKDFNKLVENKKLDFLLNDKPKLYALGRKNLLVSIRKELASYYEVKLKTDNVLIFTDVKEKEYIEQIRKFTGLFGEYARANLMFEQSPFSVLWIFSDKDDVNSAMIGMLTGSDGYFSGLFDPSYGVLFTDIYSGLGVFSHEYTHALHAGDASKNNQSHPKWLKEMLSTGNEEIDYDEKLNKIELNKLGGRFESMLDGIANDKIIPLEKLIIMSNEELMDGKNIELFYAEVRYLGLYLQEKGLLKMFYEQYKKDYNTDKTGKTTLETVLKMKLDGFQRIWERWIVSLPDKNTK